MSTSCEYCAYYAYDEYLEDYVCQINLDEDEVARFLSQPNYSCPYFRSDDEYAVVGKQN